MTPEVSFTTEDEAKEILDVMASMIKRYGFSSINDLSRLIGFPTKFSNASLGWTDLSEVKPMFTEDGYRITFPEPIVID